MITLSILHVDIRKTARGPSDTANKNQHPLVPVFPPDFVTKFRVSRLIVLDLIRLTPAIRSWAVVGGEMLPSYSQIQLKQSSKLQEKVAQCRGMEFFKMGYNERGDFLMGHNTPLHTMLNT